MFLPIIIKFVQVKLKSFTFKTNVGRCYSMIYTTLGYIVSLILLNKIFHQKASIEPFKWLRCYFIFTNIFVEFDNKC